ncbi:Protein FAR1-RELATED SEQUENCE 5 [Linum grandiflorum]
MQPGEVSMMNTHFREMIRQDLNYYIDTQEDNNDYIKSIFWSDGQMRADYKVFGDSISFDTTYRTNEHYRPLAMFVGYNHNRRVCLFGAALLYDEMTKTFKWLFKTFKTCMEGRVPKTIFTDQAAAITAGIR